MGIKYNNNKISMKSTDAQYPYYNGNKLSQVYYNGNLVWKKYTPLDFTFNGNSVTGYTGSSTSFTIPSTYSLVTDIDGTPIYIAGSDITVTAIADDAFANNTTVTSVTIPSSITSIGARAFQHCINLSTVNMSATPTYIKYCAFAITNLTGLSSYMYNCPNIEQGCFAFRNNWYINTTDSGIHTRLRKANLGRLQGTGNFTGYWGYGYVSSVYFKFYCYWKSGSQDSGFYCNYIIARFGLRDHNNTRTHLFERKSGYLYQGNSSQTGNEYIVGYYNFEDVNTYNIGYEVGYNAHAETLGREWSISDAGTLEAQCYAACYVITDCILQGSKILLANNTYKNIEDLQYTDLLKVWNFELGKYDYQYPLAIIIKSKVKFYRRLHLEDGTYIDITGQHEFYDPVHHTIRVYGSGSIHTIKPEDDYYVMKYVTDTTYNSVKVINIEDKDSEQAIQSYSLVTGGTISYFVDDVLSCMKTIEYVGLTEENKFGKHFAKDKETCYTYDRFEKEIYADSSKYIILGNNLQYVDYYNKDTSGFDGLLDPFKHMRPPPQHEGKIICTIGFLEDNNLKEEQHIEDELITLPEFKSNKYTKWYVVGEYKEYKPGDTITVNFSTLIRAI